MELLEERDKKQKELDQLLEENMLFEADEPAEGVQIDEDAGTNTFKTSEKNRVGSKLLYSKKSDPSLNSKGKKKLG